MCFVEWQAFLVSLFSPTGAVVVAVDQDQPVNVHWFIAYHDFTMSSNILL
jgi:hypothetical protein